MRMKQREDRPQKPHTLQIKEDRKGIFASGVLDVEAFDEETVKVMLFDRKLVVKGKNLKVASFSKENGELQLEGEVESVLYMTELSRRAGLWEKLFR